MLLFLMFASRRADPEDLKANIRRQNLDDNNDNNNDGDHIHWKLLTLTESELISANYINH